MREGDFVCVAAEGLRRAFSVCVAAKELTSDLSRELRGNGVAGNGRYPTPPGVLYRCENKRVAEKGFCNTMKTKARCPEGNAEMHACVELAHSLEKRVEPGPTVGAAWQPWRKIPDG